MSSSSRNPNPNPFAAFAATSSRRRQINTKVNATANATGWMTTRKTGRDDAAIEAAKTAAAETRRRRNGGRSGRGRGGRDGVSVRRRGRRDDEEEDDDDDEEDDDDGFIVPSEDEEEDDDDDHFDEGEWNSDLEDDDVDVDDDGFEKKKTKEKKEKKKKKKGNAEKKGRSKETEMKTKTRSVRSKYFALAEDDNHDDDVDDDVNDDDDNDAKEEKKDDDDDRADDRRRANIHRKEITFQTTKKRRRILEDSDSSSDDNNDNNNDNNNDDNDDDSDRELWRTPPALQKKRPRQPLFHDVERTNDRQKRRDGLDIDDDDSDDSEDLALAEALAISKAEHDSLLEHTPEKRRTNTSDHEETKPKRKRLQKRWGASSLSTLEDRDDRGHYDKLQMQKKTKTQKEKQKKQNNKNNNNNNNSSHKRNKQKNVDLTLDSDEDEDNRTVLFDEDDMKDEESEDDDKHHDNYRVITHEEQTAAQVLKEANALSAKIVNIVTGWCGGWEGAVRGLILGEDGALAMGTTVVGDTVTDTVDVGVTDTVDADESSSGGKKKGNNQADDKDPDAMWISKQDMKEIMPAVELAEYQLLGVNWMALLNRLTFGETTNGNTTHKGKGGRENNGRGVTVNGILADEMGLGKTVQTIAFLAWLNYQTRGSKPKAKGGSQSGDAIEIDDDSANESQETFHVADSDGDDPPSTSPSSAVNQQRCRPHLIVVPASVLSNWLNEFQKFAPDMHVVKYHGSLAEREEIRERLRASLPNTKNRLFLNTKPLDVVLTTFSYFSSEKSEDRSFLKKFRFDYLVVDEGHTLKNPKGLRYRNLDEFQTSHRLLLTGTPVQNSPKELMSLLCFLMPLFQTKTKAKKRKRRRDDHDDDDDDNDGGERMLEHFVQLEGGADDDEKAYRKLKQLFAPFVLRRKKDDVLSMIMPPKTRRVDLVQMDDATRSVYDSIISNHVQARNNATSKSSEVAKQKNLFTALRKAANHPLLLRTRHTDEKEVDNLARLLFSYGYFGSDATCTLQLVKNELANFSDYDIHCAALTMMEENPKRSEFLEKYTLAVNDLFCSPKFVRLRSLLPELISDGHRVLIFSQWTRVLDLMDNLMESLEMKFLRLDGSTAVSERQTLIDEFTNDPTIPVFLLSTRAGGMGLNLTAADTCILHDLDFNPFNDRQAEDRCHRIGQKKPVTIIKMVTQGTVDEDIYSVQERKAKMNEAIMEENGGKKRKKSSKSDETEEIARIMNAAVDRFLKSPTRQPDTRKQTVINVDD